jgi:hypothetical protein
LELPSIPSNRIPLPRNGEETLYLRALHGAAVDSDEHIADPDEPAALARLIEVVKTQL